MKTYLNFSFYCPYCIFILIIISILAISCQCQKKKKEESSTSGTTLAYKHISTSDYELYKPISEPQAVLVLFGGYPEVAKDIMREFDILEEAKNSQIAIVFSNHNQKLWLDNTELEKLANNFQNVFSENDLPDDNIYIGGFSSGGNVTIHLASYLIDNEKIGIEPKGIFIIDSPIDLAELYYNSEMNIKRNFSQPSIDESKWILKTLENKFGNPHNDLKPYEKHSVFTLKTKNINNWKKLKHIKIRMYTEPDTLWWKKHRMTDYEQTNAYLIKKLCELLNDNNFTAVEYIPTENKGYRSNGERHPHSWAIVDTKQLIYWMKNK